jgi:transcriptional regulator with XRE-family HTH domain
LTAEELGRRAGLVLGRDKPISPSAVRNQENGTNGIPLDTAQAYAEILGVTPSQIIWGDDETAEPGAGGSAAAHNGPTPVELWEELAIPALRVVSGAWLPLIMDTGKPQSEDHIVVGLKGWNASIANLQAMQVIDHSLEPVYRRGAYLICAPLAETYIFDGAYVLAVMFRGSEIVNSIRRVHETDRAIILRPVNERSSETPVGLQVLQEVDGVSTWVPLNQCWIESVVLASLHHETPNGRPIRVVQEAPTDGSTPDEMEDPRSIGELRRALHDEAWPSRDLDFIGIRLRDRPKERR